MKNENIRSAVGSIDMALSFDVLEYLSQRGGNKFIEQLEAVARVRFVFWIPDGECEQDVEPDGLDA